MYDLSAIFFVVFYLFVFIQSLDHTLEQKRQRFPMTHFFSTFTQLQVTQKLTKSITGYVVSTLYLYLGLDAKYLLSKTFIM